MRQFVKFTNNEEGVKLKVDCYNLDPRGGVDEIINLLSQRGFILTFIDPDSVHALKQSNYEEIINDMTGLKAKGFTWEID